MNPVRVSSLSPTLRAVALFALLYALFAVVSFSAENAPAAVDLAAAFAEGRVSGSDAKLSSETTDGGSVLRVTTGHAKQWPGANLAAPDAGWDFSPYAAIEIALHNRSAARLTLTARVDNKGADGQKNCVNGSVELGPEERGVLRVPLRRTKQDTLDGKLFGMRGYPVGIGPGWQTIDPTKITRINVFLTKPAADHLFDIESIRATGRFELATPSTSDANPFIPFIDKFGQYRHRDWLGKVHSLDELDARRGEEARELAAAPAPAEWNQFGGWKAGPQLEATGFFRTEKRDGKWWLVDPEGRLFFSIGMDAMSSSEATVVQDREHFFADFPGHEPDFAAFLMKNVAPLKGHYAGRKVRAFSFGGANLLRKYGTGWTEATNEVAQRRLRSWGFNTIGMWSDPQLREMRRTPYVDHFGSWGARMIDASEGHWGKFPDPFDPKLRESLRKRMEEKRGKSAGDPWCLGYFSDNEMSWGDETSLAIATLQSPASQPAKAAFIADLQKKYGTIEKLNAVWGSAHASWEALRTSTAAPDYAKARPDLTAFYTRIAEEYFRAARDAIKEVAPKQLYLGCRFAWGNPLAFAAAAKYCDVVSFNLYYRNLADFVWEGGADVPLIVGEFHFGALDRGFFHGGLRPVENQTARAEIFAAYVRGALRDRRFVGCHWFKYQDEPVTGRSHDEENFQIGFVDIADTPYREMVEASRAIAREMYLLRSAPYEP